jgi:hypothetical protein
MVLIPNDAGIRMRMQTETALQPDPPVSEIPADLAELHPGQPFRQESRKFCRKTPTRPSSRAAR